MKSKLISLDAIVDEYIDHTNFEGNLDKTVVRKFANQAAKKLSGPEQWSHAVSLIHIKNYSGQLPDDWRRSIQAGFIKYPENDKVRRIQIVQWIQEAFGEEGCELEINVRCPDCGETECTCDTTEFIVDVDELWDRAHPEYRYAFMENFYRYGGLGKDNVPRMKIAPDFKLMRYAQHNFHRADYHIGDCKGMDTKLLANCPEEYSINPPRIQTTFEEGVVLMAYYAMLTDDSGYVRIPDVEEVWEAIVWFIDMRMLWRQYRRSKKPADRILYREAKQQRQEKMSAARAKINIPAFDEWMSWVNNHWNKQVRYTDWRENMNRQRPDEFNPPQV